MWTDTYVPVDPPQRGAVHDVVTADVAIVGAGYTGLWTAYSLLSIDPTLRVVLIDANTVGFGASGRNGGWCSALLPMGLDSVARSTDRSAAVRLQRAMYDTVSEIERVVNLEGIDCGFHRGGTVELARNLPQQRRFAASVAHHQSFGFTDDDYRLLSADDVSNIVRATKVLGGAYTPHCAAVHPLRLAHGLAGAVERRGATIFEHSPVHEIRPGLAICRDGVVKADVVVRATEAFTPSLRRQRRTIAPIHSLMIATEPLTDDMWRQIGLHDRPTFSDGRHMIIYGQRTADGRLAFGGRGAPYHFGSSVRPRHDSDPRVHAALAETLKDLFPVLGHTTITHQWGGAVGTARDWWCSAMFDRRSGLASGGGYVGDGVGTSNLVGRALADLITDRSTDLSALPFVGHRSRKWEPEPLRWLGINAMVRVPVGADRHEDRTGRSSPLRTAVLSRLTGH